jgi:flagellar biosynthesis/type III secretory pathway M-ring protein FliF/YscJ
VVYEDDEEGDEYDALEGPRSPVELAAGLRLQALAEGPPPAAQRTEVEKQVTKIAQGHPESVAEVLQAWLRQ